MPIVQKRPDAKPDIKPAIPKVEPDKAKSIIIDTKYTPRSSLLKYVEGATWTVNYYSQYHDRDNATYAQDPGQSPIYQQYRKIERLELKVDRPLEQQQDQESKGFSVKGSAILPLSIIPNEGDMFAADVGDGREGVFQIDNSEKRSLYKESVYFIEYTLLYYSDSEPQMRQDLESKVIHNLHYVREFAQYGQNAIITTEQYKVLAELEFELKRVKKDYFDSFFSKEYSTLLVPTQSVPVYDSYVVKVINALYNTQDTYEYQWMRALNVEDDNYLKLPTVWDALLRRDIELIHTCQQEMGLVRATSFHPEPLMEGIRYSGISLVVYPLPRNNAIDEYNNRMRKAPVELSLAELSSHKGNTQPLIANNTVTHLGEQMDIHYPVTIDKYYVFSKAFYTQEGKKSLLEVLAENYLQREANRPELVLKLLKNCWKWGKLEKYYYTPVIMILAINILKELS